MMIDKEKQFSRQNEFIKNSYDRINLTVPKGYKEKIKKRAESERKSINAWLKDLIDEKIMIFRNSSHVRIIKHNSHKNSHEFKINL